MSPVCDPRSEWNRVRVDQAPAVGQVDRVADQFGAHVLGHGVADDLPVEQVDRGGQVPPPLRGGQVGDVTDEALPRGWRGEVAADHLRRRCRGGILAGQPSTAPPRDADEVPFAHDPLDPLAVDSAAASAQLVGDARRAVPAAVLVVDAADLLGQLVFGVGPHLSGWLGGQPLVVALPTRYRQDAAQPRDAVAGVVFTDEPVAVTHRPISLAK